MLGVDRRLRILERVAEDQTIQVGALAAELGVSEMTIRRDIRRLERDGFLRRTYGGATAHLTRSLDLAFNARALQRAAEKRLIGMTATRLVDQADRCIYVGIGTTAEQFARYLPARPDLTVVTASLPIASLLGTRPLRVVCLGGTVRRDELSCIGPAALATLGRYRFDLAVIGTAGITARAGLTELDEDDAAVNRRVVELAARLVVIADGSKVGAMAMAVVAPASPGTTLVTDAAASAGSLAELQAAGVDVRIATAATAHADREERRAPVAAGNGVRAAG